MPPGSDNVDYSHLGRWLEGQMVRERRGGGSSDGGDGMDRVTRRIDALEADVKSLIKDVAEIKGRLSQMPTTFQMLTWYVGVAIGLTGLVFAVARSIH
jgi:hypothetical protein